MSNEVEVRLDANGAVIVDKKAAEAYRKKQESARREMDDYRSIYGTFDDSYLREPMPAVTATVENGKRVNICRAGRSTIKVIL